MGIREDLLQFNLMFFRFTLKAVVLAFALAFMPFSIWFQPPGDRGRPVGLDADSLGGVGRVLVQESRKCGCFLCFCFLFLIFNQGYVY